MKNKSANERAFEISQKEKTSLRQKGGHVRVREGPLRPSLAAAHKDHMENHRFDGPPEVDQTQPEKNEKQTTNNFYSAM